MNFLKILFGASGAASVTVAEARQRLESSQPPFVLDVRQPDEFRSGHLYNAALIPLDELPRRMHELPKDQDILCVCRSGARSGAAARQLAGAGYRALNLQGGMMAWQHADYPIKRGK